MTIDTEVRELDGTLSFPVPKKETYAWRYNGNPRKRSDFATIRETYSPSELWIGEFWDGASDSSIRDRGWSSSGGGWERFES